MAKVKTAPSAPPLTVVADRVNAHGGIDAAHRDAVAEYLSRYAEAAMETAINEQLARAEAVAKVTDQTRLSATMSWIYGEDRIALARKTVANGGLGVRNLGAYSQSDAEYYVRAPGDGTVTWGAGPGPFAWVDLAVPTEPAAMEDPDKLALY